MSEFIGSRISLISKSDIRYVGTLHEISSESSTVALENVKSFGTEGRRNKPEEEIAASDEIYEYIVFRGSDVKDLRIEEAPKESRAPAAPVPNDPAILGSGSRPTQPPVAGTRQGGPSQPPPFPYSQPPYNSQYPNQRFGGPQPPHMGYGAPPPGAYPGYGGPGFPSGPGFYGPPAPGFPPHAGNFPPPHAPGQQQHNVAPFKPQVPQHPLETDATKNPLVRDRPATKTSQEQSPAVEEITKQQDEIVAPRPPVETKPSVTVPLQAEPSQAGPKSVSNGKVALPRAPANIKGTNSASLGQSNQSVATANAAMQYQSATQAATAAVAAAMAKLPPPGQAKPVHGNGPNSFDQLAQKVQEMRVEDRPRGADRGGARGRGRRGPPREPVKPVDVPTTDFDFASANAKFNKQDLMKEAIASGSPLGTAAQDSTAPSADPSTPSDGAVTIPTATVTPYSKTSFFDNISSEAKEREEAADRHRRPGGAEFRSEERRRNMETFGLGSVDNRYSGSHRGRGRGRGRARGSFRGGRGAVNGAA